MPHDSQATATFRHEHRPIWKEGNGPRLLQPFGDDDNPEIPFLSRFEVDASVRQGRWLPDDRRGRIIVVQFMRSERLFPYLLSAAPHDCRRSSSEGDSPLQPRPL